ncbi:protein-tyrosine phosphatase-like protein [Obelidium mucronatum]|nr:protein-tyrosine phosphatase-like protein [Obelidium mucronatum]
MSDAHIAGLIAQLPADKQHNTPWLRAILNQKQGFKQPSRIERMQVAVDQREAERVKQALANARVDSFNGAESYEAWRRSPKQPGAVLVGPPVGAKASAQNHPFGRNRYSNIFPYDHARVMLTGAPHDYINASLLDTGALANTPAAERYIAAQGPLKNTAADFWLMAWEQNSRVIVMLTGCTEGGRDKCFNYWPSKGEPAWSFEFTGVISFNIECIDEVKAAPGLDVRSFKVVATSTTSTDSENASTVERIIRQVHFTSWPDHQSSDPSSL